MDYSLKVISAEDTFNGAPLLAGLRRLDSWLVDAQCASLDPGDLWISRRGGRAKSLFLRTRVLGLPALLPFVAIEVLWPGIRRRFAQSRHFPISHAHVGLGYLNMFEATSEDLYLARATELVRPLEEMSSPLAKGAGWGMKHEWVTVKGVISSDTPCHSQTAYVYEFLARLLEHAGDSNLQRFLQRIAYHTANDFPEWWERDRLVSSYSMLDERRIVNANSYRMLILLDAGKRFGSQEFVNKGLGTLRYVLSMQQTDGSWPYGEQEKFVDTYHTCFVLKNLYKVKDLVGDLRVDVEHSIERGLRFYFQNLFDPNGYPKPFAVKPRLVLHRYDSYDLAESIGLLALMKIDRERLTRLLDFALSEFQTRAGWFKYRVYPFVPFKGIPYMRYANSAMFLALTSVILAYGIEQREN